MLGHYLNGLKHMLLKNLQLQQYRNYNNFSVDFETPEKITVFTGSNGKGKTNILEAIYTLSLTKSFRTSRQQDVIQWGQEFGRIKGFFSFDDEDDKKKVTYESDKVNISDEVNKESVDNKIESASTDSQNMREIMSTEREVFIGISPNPSKNLKENGVKKSTPEFIGNCPTVFFHPEDLNMLYLGPELRRRFLDILGIQVNRNYYRAIRTYQRILEQRNALLKKIQAREASVADLDVWDEQVIDPGSQIIVERLRLIDFLSDRLSELYSNIAGSSQKINIYYRCFIDQKLTNFQINKEEIREKFQNFLLENRNKDLSAGFTTLGPHRDDLQFELNQHSLVSHASRGEYRSLFLALKQAELAWYQKQTNHRPILLLDDVFSELDPARQYHLLESISNYQCFISTTHLPSILENLAINCIDLEKF